MSRVKTIKQLSASLDRHYDSAGPGRLIAQLPSPRYTVELFEGFHRIYDSMPTETPGDAAQALAEEELAQRDEALMEGQEEGANAEDQPGVGKKKVGQDSIPLNKTAAHWDGELSEAEQQIKKDRHAVTDASMPMPARLRALGRLNALRFRGK